MVEKSSESAQLALSTVPQIENQIRDAENRVAEAEDVFDFLTDIHEIEY